MTKLPSMPLFPADFFAATQEMSGAAARVYLFLLGQAWLHDGALPNDDLKLARLARLNSPSWRKVKAEVIAKFELCDDGFLRNRRMQRDRLRVTQLSSTNSQSAKQRWEQKSFNYNDHVNAKALQSDYDGSSNQNQIQNKENFLFNREKKEKKFPPNWVPSKRVGDRLFYVGQSCPAYDGQDPKRWEILTREKCDGGSVG